MVVGVKFSSMNLLCDGFKAWYFVPEGFENIVEAQCKVVIRILGRGSIFVRAGGIIQGESDNYRFLSRADITTATIYGVGVQTP